jgi:hypothetical protein
MPYLDPPNSIDDMHHLAQLYLAAHPEAREMNETLREQTGQVHEHFYTSSLMADLITWARARQLISRKTAAFMEERRRWVFATPDEKITLGSHILGAPPRRQPTISSVDMCRWIAATDDIGPVDEVMLFTLPAAVTLLAHYAADATNPEIDRERAAQLAAWLEEQIDGEAAD